MKEIATKQFSARITLEAAIIVPIVMFVVAGMLYMTMYVHDVIAMKSKAYEAGIEYVFNDKSKETVLTKLEKSSFFVINPQVSISEEVEGYAIEISFTGKGNVKIIHSIVNSGKKQKIYVPKKMSGEILYGSKVLIEELEERKEKR